jgi:hypothetical protein
LEIVYILDYLFDYPKDGMTKSEDGIGNLARNNSNICLDRCRGCFEEEIIGSALCV